MLISIAKDAWSYLFENEKWKDDLKIFWFYEDQSVVTAQQQPQPQQQNNQNCSWVETK